MRSRWLRRSRRLRRGRAIGLVFKSSFDKANRTSGSAKRGIGLEAALPIFAEIVRRSAFPSSPTCTKQPMRAGCSSGRRVADPGFPVPTDRSFGRGGRDRPAGQRQEGPVSRTLGHEERRRQARRGGPSRHPGDGTGSSFGYNTLVSDMRALPIFARETGAPVIFDATHSVQQPGGQGTSSGGERAFVRVLARAAVAVGVAGVFIETHQDPDHAPSDGPDMLSLKDFEALVAELQDFDRLAKRHAETA